MCVAVPAYVHFGSALHTRIIRLLSQVLRYVGQPAVRRQLISSIPDHDLVIMSYESIRSDCQELSSQVQPVAQWHTPSHI